CLEWCRRLSWHDPRVRDCAELAIDELLRMHELAEQMLDLNRPRAPKSQRADPLTVAREVARLATAGAGADGIEISVNGGSSHTATIAPDALKQVLLNLVQNAREAATQAGRDVPRIAIDVDDAGDDVASRVRDNGPGVPEELRARSFDPFFTTKSAVDGVGLGLFVAEGLIRTPRGGRVALAKDE